MKEIAEEIGKKLFNDIDNICHEQVYYPLGDLGLRSVYFSLHEDILERLCSQLTGQVLWYLKQKL